MLYSFCVGIKANYGLATAEFKESEQWLGRNMWVTVAYFDVPSIDMGGGGSLVALSTQTITGSSVHSRFH
jgi:hypothetical protein